ncbi:hypothetical protein, partial [Escherichia coli]|uniref:hypothetical protein n=2 Tax=Enterobacterales TaxID=91347 RepID=UPI0021805B16
SAKGDDKFITTDYLQQCLQSIQQTTPARYPGLSIEHGEIRQFGKPRHCAANRRGQYQTTLRDQAGRYRTVSIISLYAWEA